MYKIELLNDKPKQKFKVVIDGFDQAEITIEFKSQQYGWFLSMIWGTFILNNERISTSPNLLRQFQNIIPFGIQVSGVDSIDPIKIDSWLSDNEMFILEASDIAEIEALYVK